MLNSLYGNSRGLGITGRSTTPLPTATSSLSKALFSYPTSTSTGRTSSTPTSTTSIPSGGGSSRRNVGDRTGYVPPAPAPNVIPASKSGTGVPVNVPPSNNEELIKYLAQMMQWNQPAAPAAPSTTTINIPQSPAPIPNSAYDSGEGDAASTSTLPQQVDPVLTDYFGGRGQGSSLGNWTGSAGGGMNNNFYKMI